MKKILVKKDSYFDSVFLMLLSKELKESGQVTDSIVAMGTPMNLELLGSLAYPASELAGATPNDLIVAVDCPSVSAVEAAVAAAEALLARKKPASAEGTVAPPRSLEGALDRLPGANLAVISLPGAYAAREARRALEKGLHVMLFSDNVSLADEVSLKTLATSKGLLVMGPDCGTAIINGQPLCFANVVRRGAVGIVAASGTGLQEVSVLVDRFGSGVSQAIGTGGRDLKNERVGGLTMLAGIQALSLDEATKVIVVVSKPPARSVADKVIRALEETGKPCVVHFIGVDPPKGVSRGLHWAASLEEAARFAAALAQGKPFAPQTFDLAPADIDALVSRETAGMAKAQRFLRGYYTGGTLADEAWILLHKLTGAVWSNNQTDPKFVLADPKVSVGHTVVDLGDDVFTVGRPHPMIDPSTRTDRVDAERDDPSIAVMLVDVVLGYGSHADPAGALVPSLVAAKKAAAQRGGYLAVVASVTGTDRDFQGLAGQRAKLESAGVVVMPSNYQASVLAVKFIEKAASK